MPEEKKSKGKSIEILKADDQKRIIYGIVLKPDVPDSQDDIMTEDEITKSAHNYLMFYRNTGVQHEDYADAQIVESYVTPDDMIVNERYVAKGTWIVAMKIFSDILWTKVKQGDYNAFSAGGYARKEAMV